MYLFWSYYTIIYVSESRGLKEIFEGFDFAVFYCKNGAIYGIIEPRFYERGFFMGGMIQLYIGNGKGKTTAAIGQAVRAAGANMKVLLVQFLKDNRSNELKALRTLKGVHIADAPDSVPFWFEMSDGEKRDYAILQNNTFDEAVLNARRFDMIVLDEVIDAVDFGIIDANKLIDFMLHKPEKLELVITGHSDIPEITRLCDYVSEVRAVKHPFDKGAPARAGIEY